jgi:hypothetical protein
MDTLKDLSEEIHNAQRRVDLEGKLSDDDECRLYLNGALLSELVAYHLPSKKRQSRKFGKVRVTIERIEE